MEDNLFSSSKKVAQMIVQPRIIKNNKNKNNGCGTASGNLVDNY